MQSVQQWIWDTARALDLGGRGGDLRGELVGAGEGIRTSLDIHAPPRTGGPLRPNSRALSTASQVAMEYPLKLFKTANFTHTAAPFTAMVDRCSIQAATLRSPARSARWRAMWMALDFCISAGCSCPL